MFRSSVIFRLWCGIGLLGAAAAPAQIPGDGAGDPAALKTRALHFEQTGQKAEAARMYEEMIRLQPESALILAPRLVDLQVEMGDEASALKWAETVMARHPDPAAYRAAVLARLGRTDEARILLEEELKTELQPARRTALHWQLAEQCLAGNDRAGAEAALRAALEESRDDPQLQRAAERRLRSFIDDRGPRRNEEGSP